MPLEKNDYQLLKKKTAFCGRLLCLVPLESARTIKQQLCINKIEIIIIEVVAGDRCHAGVCGIGVNNQTEAERQWKEL